MRKAILTLCGIGLCFLSEGQEKVSASAVVKEVIVYTNSAEISNQVNVKLDRGSVSLYIQNVAQNLDLNSIQLSGPDGITVLSISQNKSEEMEVIHPIHRRLKDSLDIVIVKRDGLMHKQKAAQGALNILNNDKLFGGNNTINLGDVSKLIEYYQTKAVELNASIDALNKSIALENKNVARLQEKIRSFTGNGGQLVIQLNNSKPIQGDIYLSYVSRAANWKAYYDLRAKSISSPLNILYKAKVTQYTGVDWKNVKLTLSTGNPALQGNAPILTPTYAQYYDPTSQGLVARTYGVQAKTQNRVQSVATKEVAGDAMLMESATIGTPSTVMDQNQLSATFDIDVPYDIVSNGQPHSVTLQEFTHPAVYKYYAVPKMDKDAFLLAEVKDYEKLNLIPGEANIIFENMFVGTSYIDPSITTDTMNLSMGRDKSISIKRERIMDEKSTVVSGSSKRQNYTYEIRVRNSKSTAIQMLLKDQYPISTDKSIEVSLVNNGGAVVNDETGVLTWNIEVKPGETKTYRFTYVVKHPKDRIVNFN